MFVIVPKAAIGHKHILDRCTVGIVFADAVRMIGTVKRINFDAHSFQSLVSRRLQDELSFVHVLQTTPVRLALCYPSPYPIAMSSLGYQVVYRILNECLRPRVRAERAFLPDHMVSSRQPTKEPFLTYESRFAVGEATAVFFSVAYELEVSGFFTCLELAAIPVLREERTHRDPLVICGGPLTFSNPLPLGPFADVVLVGEAEDSLPLLMEKLDEGGWGRQSEQSRTLLLQELATLPGIWVPSIHEEKLPPVTQCQNEKLPACSSVITPHAELRSMFLIEPERGCSRGCTYCVMRRSTNGGMRLVALEKIKSLLPESIKRVGLVGAAVTDHPKLPQILHHIVIERGLEVGISSLRADRLTEEIVKLLALGGYQTLTVASDGASEQLRAQIQRRTHERHLIRAAELARQHKLRQYKVYMMVGVPGETSQDLDELIRFTKELSSIVKTSLGVAPFVAKRNTPLDGTPFAGIKEIEQKLMYLRKGLGAAAEVRPTSARWAWVEYVLAQGGMDAGRRAYQAYRAGGQFQAWQQAFHGWENKRRSLRVVE